MLVIVCGLLASVCNLWSCMLFRRSLLSLLFLVRSMVRCSSVCVVSAISVVTVRIDLLKYLLSGRLRLLIDVCGVASAVVWICVIASSSVFVP